MPGSGRGMGHPRNLQIASTGQREAFREASVCVSSLVKTFWRGSFLPFSLFTSIQLAVTCELAPCRRLWPTRGSCGTSRTRCPLTRPLESCGGRIGPACRWRRFFGGKGAFSQLPGMNAFCQRDGGRCSSFWLGPWQLLGTRKHEACGLE